MIFNETKNQLIEFSNARAENETDEIEELVFFLFFQVILSFFCPSVGHLDKKNSECLKNIFWTQTFHSIHIAKKYKEKPSQNLSTVCSLILFRMLVSKPDSVNQARESPWK